MSGFSSRTIILLILCFAMASVFAKDSKVIVDGSTVAIEYSLELENGLVFETNVGKTPFEFVAGKSAGKVFPAVEQALMGLKVNDKKELLLKPEQAFGPVNPKKFVSVKPDTVPEKLRSVGSELIATAPNGQEQSGIVTQVLADRIVLNFNHPLAGQAVKFKVKVLSIK